jgi:uncharacterized phage-associated protein
MYEHFIILFSDYKDGRRIAYHKSSESFSEIFEVMDIMTELKAEFEHLSFGFHHLQTNSSTWQSVIEYDKFFADVTPVLSLEEFKRIIRSDSEVTALDVANLITSRITCTHLKLQKLIYLFFCKYIKKYGSSPFREKFFAWQYGPVVKEVYDKYKIYGREVISGEDDTEVILKEEPFKLSVYSRFMKTPIHKRVVEVVDETIAQYGSLPASTLVEITHEKNGPWDKIFRNGLGRDQIIPEDLIKEYCIKK